LFSPLLSLKPRNPPPPLQVMILFLHTKQALAYRETTRHSILLSK
jgi:hypothetical protein